MVVAGMIELRDLVLDLGQGPLFQQLNLQLSEQRIGLVGHNGSGKSSLLRLLNGLAQPQQGQVWVHGQNAKQGPAAMASLVGFIFQNPDHQLIFPTVLEELCFGLLNQGVAASTAKQLSMDILAQYGRTELAERSVHTLSEGQKQLVCILAVLLMRPKLLVLDEPFSALDLPSRYQLLAFLQNLPQQIIMISHELELLADFDRLLWLEGGRVRADGPAEQVLASYRLAARAMAGAQPC